MFCHLSNMTSPASKARTRPESRTQRTVSIPGDGERGPQVRSRHLQLRLKEHIIHNGKNHQTSG